VESINKGLAILQHLSNTDGHARRLSILAEIADGYTDFGHVYSRAAIEANISFRARTSRWQDARSAFQKSLEGWLEIKLLGAPASTIGDRPV
jgi:hypothetical protein